MAQRLVPTWMRLASLALAFGVACGRGAMSVGARDAAREGTPSTGTGGLTGLIIGFGGAVGAGGRSGDGGATGGTNRDASEDPQIDCSFMALWNAVVDAAHVIGYCAPIGTCDANVASTDAGAGSCSPLGDIGDAGLVLSHGCLGVNGPSSRMGCWSIDFDAEGRLVGGSLNVAAWADCRWPYYGGKRLYFECYSE